MTYLRSIVLCVLSWTLLAGFAEPTGLPAILQKRLGAGAQEPLAAGDESIRARVALRRFFAERDFLPAWSGDGGRLLLDDLLLAIEQSSAHGLASDDYHQSSLRQAIATGDRVAIELLATDAYLTLAAHLVGGRLNPVTIEPDWTASRRERDLVQHLEGALTERAIAASLLQLEPTAPGYAVLKDALAMYRQAAREGGWEPIAPGAPLKVGESGPRVLALRQRLRATGLLAPADTPSDQFDVELESAVASFQRRIGIEADGVVGRVTLRELNKRPTDRIEQIRANLERWRWLPVDLGNRHIRVNIADFRLEVRDDGKVERTHDVIVGRTYRMTPVFSGEISYVVLNPWWETPDNLARLDKLPGFKKDPASVARLGFEVLDRSGSVIEPSRIQWGDYGADNFPFRLRQRPGPQNALGQIKLMFPNKHNVYLHDTPTRELFSRSERAFSSGCVRVADAIGLTEWVLQATPGWSRVRIDATLVSGRETRVDLGTKVPVHILYFTAVAEPDGAVRLINDIYDRDARLVAALASAPPSSRI